jgi:glycine/D-amino acid oxidase-like deaminating enzyme
VDDELREDVAACPTLQSVRMARISAAWVDPTPDAVPVISPVPALPGFLLATGVSGHGFGIGPGAGRLAADIVAGDRPIVDPEPFAYARLVDGRPIREPGMR